MRPQSKPNIYLVVVTLALAWSTPSASVLQDRDGPVIDGFIARQARRERGEEYRDARKVMVGDLTRDGVPETVILYTIESQGGTNNYVQYVAVFARGNRGLIPVTRAEVGGKMRRSVALASVEDNTIQLATLSYGPKDAACCPSVKGTTCYALVGRALREQKHGSTRGRHN